MNECRLKKKGNILFSWFINKIWSKNILKVSLQNKLEIFRYNNNTAENDMSHKIISL